MFCLEQWTFQGLTLTFSIPMTRAAFLVLSRTDAHVYLSLNGRLVQGCVVPIVSCVGVRAATQQQTHDLGVSERTGVVKRDETAVIARVNVRSGLQEMFNHVLSSKA